MSLCTPNICLSLNGTVTHMQVTHAVDTNVPHTMTDVGWDLSLTKVWKVSFFLSFFFDTNSMSVFPKNVDSYDPST